MSKLKKIVSDLMLVFGKYSEYELAKKSGVSQSTINRILSGQTENPSETSLKKIANYFKVTPEQLIGNEPINKVKIFPSSKSYIHIKGNLRKLMVAHNINELNLAKNTGVNQSTINRILSGETPNPRGSSLRKIAEYFDISVSQLLNSDKISVLNMSDKSNSSITEVKNFKIPFINFEELKNLQNILNNEQYINQKNKHVFLEKPSAAGCFATEIIDDSMSSEFEKGNVLIVDSLLSAKHGDYVIIQLKNNEILFRELAIVNNKKYIQKYYPNLETTQLNNQFEILGVVTEVRRPLKKDSR